MNKSIINKNLWVELFLDLKSRTLEPLNQPTFVFYFLSVICVIGPWSFWSEIIQKFGLIPSNVEIGLKSKLLLQSSLVSFVSAFIASSCLQLILAEKTKSLRAFSMFTGTFVFLCLYLCNVSQENIIIIPSGMLAFSLSLWVWWVANAKVSDLIEGETKYDNPTGGSENIPLKGSVDGFIH